MSWIVVPVLTGKHRQLKTVRVIASERCSLTLRRDESASFNDGEDDAHIDLANISEHEALDDAIATARDMVASDAHAEPPATEVESAAERRER